MPAECRRLIAAGGIGRIAFGTVSGPVVFPVNFAVVAGTIVIRTGEGTMIAGHAGEQVAFEVDHIDEALCQGWSVLVRGQAHRVAHPAELEIIRQRRRDLAVARRRPRRLRARHPGHHHRPPDREPLTQPPQHQRGRPTQGRPRWLPVYSCSPTRAARSASRQV